jgi:hypothetical protein
MNRLGISFVNVVDRGSNVERNHLALPVPSSACCMRCALPVAAKVEYPRVKAVCRQVGRKPLVRAGIENPATLDNAVQHEERWSRCITAKVPKMQGLAVLRADEYRACGQRRLEKHSRFMKRLWKAPKVKGYCGNRVSTRPGTNLDFKPTFVYARAAEALGSATPSWVPELSPAENQQPISPARPECGW